MLTLNMSAEIERASDYLSDVARRHVPFAAALALSAVAYDARDAVRADMPHRFTMRRPWIVRGVGVAKATKKDLQAVVFSRDAFMADQEAGGTRTGTQIIPVGRMAHIHEKRVLSPSQWPGAASVRARTFYRAGTLFERRGRSTPEPIFLFRKKVRIAPRLGMSATVRSVVLRNFSRRFDAALTRVLAT